MQEEPQDAEADPGARTDICYSKNQEDKQKHRLKNQHRIPGGKRRQRRVDVVAVQADETRDEVGDAAHLREQVVAKAAQTVAEGEMVEIARVEQDEQAARREQRPMRALPAQDFLPAGPGTRREFA